MLPPDPARTTASETGPIVFLTPARPSRRGRRADVSWARGLPALRSCNYHPTEMATTAAFRAHARGALALPRLPPWGLPREKPNVAHLAQVRQPSVRRCGVVAHAEVDIVRWPGRTRDAR